MSLILEALKKSERQRRLGESPSIGSPVMVVRRRRSLLPALAVLIVIGVVAMWWMRREAEQPPTTETASTLASTPVPMPTPVAAKPSRAANGVAFNDAPVAAATTKAPSVMRTPSSPIPPSAEGERSRKIRDGELVAANPQAGPAATIKESEPISAADPAALAAAMASVGKPVAGPLKTPSGIQPARVGAGKDVKPAGPTPPVAAPTPAAANLNGNALKLMWELPLATRTKLPEIKLSMHVFAANPAQRFAIINDERRVEGDDIDGMKLIAIRTDGVVFEFDNVRFLYPRGGR